jgi:hypothetical protein
LTERRFCSAARRVGLLERARSTACCIVSGAVWAKADAEARRIASRAADRRMRFEDENGEFMGRKGRTVVE